MLPKAGREAEGSGCLVAGEVGLHVYAKLENWWGACLCLTAGEVEIKCGRGRTELVPS